VKQLILLATIAAAVGWTDAAGAQTYPSRPVTMIVPFAAGGPTDSLARTLAERMRVPLGQAVIIENITGAGGSTGVGKVAQATPDGYTIGIGNWSTHVVNGVVYPLSYDLLNDLEPVALLPGSPKIIVTGKTAAANNLGELVAWLKANKAAAGTAGVGSASHVAGVFFQKLTGTDFIFVPYRGTGPALQDLIAGQIDLMFDDSSQALPHIRDGNIKAYAVTSNVRLESAPDIPTVDEAGLPGFHLSVWNGIWAPKGTPAPVVATLNAAIVEALADPALRRRLADLGQVIPPKEQQTPQGLAALQRSEIKKWWPIIKAVDVRG
jgi:tripartite-type tricarboxylate transporter receptor subunit TctC